MYQGSSIYTLQYDYEEQQHAFNAIEHKMVEELVRLEQKAKATVSDAVEHALAGFSNLVNVSDDLMGWELEKGKHVKETIMTMR